MAQEVKEILGSFRESLATLAPIAERLGVAWRDHDAYDDWDTLVTLLFSTFVAGPLARVAGWPEGAELPPYDLLGSEKEACVWITVEGAAIPPNVDAVFLAFSSGNGEFSDVRWVALQRNQLAPPLTGSLAFDECSFALKFRHR